MLEAAWVLCWEYLVELSKLVLMDGFCLYLLVVKGQYVMVLPQLIWGILLCWGHQNLISQDPKASSRFMNPWGSLISRNLIVLICSENHCHFFTELIWGASPSMQKPFFHSFLLSHPDEVILLALCSRISPGGAEEPCGESGMESWSVVCRANAFLLCSLLCKFFALALRHD